MRVSRFTSVSQKNGFVFPNQVCYYKALNQYYMALKILFKLVYRKLQYNSKVFPELQGLPRFSTRMVLYSSTKFDIMKP